MSNTLAKIKLEASNRVRHSPVTQMAKAGLQLARAFTARDISARLFGLADAHRLLSGIGLPNLLAGLLRPYVEDPKMAAVWRDKRVGQNRYPGLGHKAEIQKGLVLKAPGPGGERGVIVIDFARNVYDFLACPRALEVARQYSIILHPSWSPPAMHHLWLLAHIPGGRVYATISNQLDKRIIPQFDWGGKVLPFLVSDFVNPEFFPPLPREKKVIDVLMVANWRRPTSATGSCSRR